MRGQTCGAGSDASEPLARDSAGSCRDLTGRAGEMDLRGRRADLVARGGRPVASPYPSFSFRLHARWAPGSLESVVPALVAYPSFFSPLLQATDHEMEVRRPEPEAERSVASNETVTGGASGAQRGIFIGGGKARGRCGSDPARRIRMMGR
jgi:hypothetical protein